MTKRLIACFISIIMIIPSLVISASDADSQIENDERIIFSTGFESEDSASDSNVLYIDSKGESVSRSTDGYVQIAKNTAQTDPYFDVDLSAVSQEGIVLSADLKKGESSITADLFKLRYSDNSMVTLLTLGEDGIVRCGTEDITALNTEKMTNIALFLKSDGYFEIYSDGAFAYSASTGTALGWQFIRCQILPDDFTGTLDIDNLKIYSAQAYTTEAESYIVNNDFNDEETYKDDFVRVFAGSGNSISYKIEACLEITTTDASKDPYMDIIIPDNDTFSHLVFSADFIIEKLGTKTNVFQARNAQKQFLTDLSITQEGNIYQGSSSNKIAKVSEGDKVNISVIYNVSEASYDVYINEEKKITGAKSGFSGDVERVRTQVLPNYGTGSFKIDNLKIYEGSAFREIPDTDNIIGWSQLPGDRADKIRLGDAIAYHTAADNAFYNGEKHSLTSKPFIKNGELYIPVEIAFPITGSKQVGEAVLLDDLCTAYGKELFYDETGLIIITDGEFSYKEDKEAINRLSTYLFSQRPDEEAIAALFNKSQNSSAHPRLLALGEDFDCFISQKDSLSYMADWIDNILYRADNILLTAPAEYRLQSFRLNSVVSVVRERIMTLSFAYRVTGNEAYAKRVLDEMEKVMTYPDWNPQHFLDTAELTFAMAIGYDWCYEYLAKKERADAVADAIVNMGLLQGDRQYRGRAEGTSFIFRDMNWNSVCNAGMCAGALAVMDKEPALSYAIVKNAVRSLEYMLPPFAPSGGWQEGTGYWDYAFSYLVRMVKCLETSLGEDFDIPHFTGIENSLLYAAAMRGNTADNNYHDSGETKKVSPEFLWAGDYFERSDYTAYYLNEAQKVIQNDELYRCLYYDRKTSKNISYDFPKDMLFKNLEAVSMRDSYKNNNGTYLSFHAGKNNVNHRQYDAGTFVLDMIGERWASDLGSEPLSYLGTAEKLLYRVRPEGHNTLVINPSDEIGQQKNTDCPVTKFVSKEKGAYAIADLTSAYSDSADSVIRGFMLTDDRRTVIIRDEIMLKEASEIYWFMHTAADISIKDEDTALLTIGSKSVQLKIAAEGAVAQLYMTEAEPFETSNGASGQADNSNYSKVAVKLTGSGEVSLSVRITPLNEPYAETEFVPEKISMWDIEDGSIAFVPEDYEKEYIIHSELFDDEIISPDDIYTMWELKNGSGTVGGMIQSTKTSITHQTGFGGKDSSDGSIVIKTENLTSQTGVDPFVQIECDTVQKYDVTFEFQVYADGDQTVYIQGRDSNSATELLMEMKPDGMVYFTGGKAPAAHGSWHDVALTLHCVKETMDIYLDGKLIAQGLSAMSDIKRMKIISLYSAPGEGESRNGITAVDNVRVYRGEKEQYYYTLLQDGVQTQDKAQADELYIKASSEAGIKMYLAELSQDGRINSIDMILPGEELRRKIPDGNKARLLIWDKYSLFPQVTEIETGGNSNE